MSAHASEEYPEKSIEETNFLSSNRQQDIIDFYNGETDTRAISFSNQELFNELQANGIDIYI